MSKKTLIIKKTTLLAAPLIILSGCDWFKKTPKEKPAVAAATADATSPAAANQPAGKILANVGARAITENEFKKSLQQMVQANPYFKGASVETLPKELLRKFLDQLITQALIEQYQVKNNIENDPDFKKSYEETEKLLKRSLMVQLYEKKIYDGISVTKKDIQKHFDENKERFVKAPGGILTIGASFEKEDLADDFLDKVKGKLDDFEQLAEDNKDATFKDFGRLSKGQANQGFQFDVTPGPIKDSALAMRKTPGIEKVKVAKEYWVIKAWDKKDTEYFKLDEIESHVESMLKNNKFREVLDANIKKLRDGELKVTINEEYFKSPAEDAGDTADEKDEKSASASAA